MIANQDTMGSRLNNLLDNYIESLVNNKSTRKPDIRGLIIAYKPTKKEIKLVNNVFLQTLNEIEHAIQESDDDFIEGWDYLTKTKQKKLYEFILYITTFLSEKGKITRKRKKKDPSKMVSKLHYMKEFNKLHLFSIDPIEIIGSSYCILYNIKYNKITYLESDSGLNDSGLNVTGTTIGGFNQDKSYTQSVKNNKAILQLFSTGSILALKRDINNMKYKKTKASGRCNENVLILRVWK